MSATTEQAAAWFESRAESTPMPGAREMFKIAAEALREKAERENPQPLRLEELQAGDFPFWVIIHRYGPPVHWPAIRDCVAGMDVAIWCGSEKEHLPFSEYGKAWTAYRHEPKEAK